ncbi:hypothetical protein RIF29_39618 [Crotalaria pallida]|uniref:Reverse transcriptase zinc-binding domain-containing protein n=1 Tax=Crotalaria pallida TaxID=3830 RepID=A0AAN9E7V7_CROPI
MSISKHNFIFWLLAHDSLRTKDNLHFLQDSPLCELCAGVEESRSHLFFDCPWSRQLLEEAGNWIGVEVPHFKFLNWLRWMHPGFRNKQRRQLYAIAWGLIHGMNSYRALSLLGWVALVFVWSLKKSGAVDLNFLEIESVTDPSLPSVRFLASGNGRTLQMTALPNGNVDIV